MKAKEFWIFKGTSNFCQELVMADDYETMVKQKPDGFYDIVSIADTVQGGIHVIKYSEVERLQKQLKIAVNAINHYLEVEEFLGGSISANDFKEALNEINQLNEKE